MYYVGLMSGTSADAIDAALVRMAGDGLEIVDYRQESFDADIKQALRGIDSSSSIEAASRLDGLLGRHFGQAVNALLQANNIAPEQVGAIGSHGQTILHLPEADPPQTLQIGDPNRIVGLTGITTVADFRRADLIAGGQGAPLAPAFHAWKFRADGHNRVVLNIGGIANITILPAAPDAEVRGFDTGPGNGLMDAWTQKHQHHDYDDQGRWAAEGSIHTSLLKLLLSDPYFSALPPKSTGKDDFNLDWLAGHIEKANINCAPGDLQATLLELTAVSISEAISVHAPATQEVLTCGGGVHNTTLMQRLQSLLSDITLTTTDAYGVHPDAVEAVTFAWLAHQRLRNIPANLPSVTGANKSVVLGAIYEPRSRQRESIGTQQPRSPNQVGQAD